MSLTRLSLLPLLLVLPVACFDDAPDDSGDTDDTDPVACTEEARSSVMVSVQNEAGTPKTDAEVTFAVGIGEPQLCDSWNNDGTYVCGYEVAGDLSITATAPGYEVQTHTVTVPMTADGCHVVTQELTINLLPTCDDPPPAMMVTVQDGAAAAVTGESVKWGLANADMAPVDCEEEPDGRWACAYSRFGVLDLYVEAPGFAPHFEVVTVPEGECGADTVLKTVTLQPAAAPQ